MLFEAYSRLRAQEAQALNYTWAIVLALFSIWLLKEKFRIIDFVSLLISFFGVWVISTKGQITSLQFDDALGSFLAVSTSIIWAFYWILNIKDKRPALTKLNYNFFLGFLFIALFALFTHKSLFTPQAIYGYGILGGIYVGIFEMGLTFLLWNKALELTDNTAVISNLIFFTPFLSLLFISSVLKESIHYATFIGLLLIFFSNLLQKGLPAILKRNE
jgi:drug/metabolite transporter (DMT)-like permease